MAQIFPIWTNKLPKILLFASFLLSGSLIFIVWYWFSPKYTDVGYQPQQPISFSHQQHVDELGMDCRYCHSSVEESSIAAIPSTNTCMGCHSQITPKSEEIALIEEMVSSNESIEWVRVHMLPDYAYFDHSVHVAGGVGCETCHGRVDQMEVIRQTEPLSMRWCLDCHRDPDPFLRPISEIVTMGWENEENELEHHDINPPLDCGGCHQ